MASRVPVEAPEGTAARPRVPSSSRTSASTVGLPRESRISRARIALIFAIVLYLLSRMVLLQQILLQESLLLDDGIQLLEGNQQGLHLPQRPGIGPVAERLVRVRMGFHEQAG